MHEIPGASVGAQAVVWVAVGVTTFWLALAGTVWKVFLEPAMKQLREDRKADNERCDRQIEALERRIHDLEMMSNLRQQTQAAISEIRIQQTRETP